jgi:hypothetical protein
LLLLHVLLSGQPLVSTGELAQLQAGWLWEQLKSISDATSFFNAVKAMDPIDLRKVVLAAKAEVIERER